MTTKELSKLSVGSILLDKSTNTLVKLKSALIIEEDGKGLALVQGIGKEIQYKLYVPVANLKRIELNCESLTHFGFKEHKKIARCEYKSKDKSETLISLTGFDGYKYFALAHKDPSCGKYEANAVYIRFDKNICKYIDELQNLLRTLKFKKPRVLVTY